MLLGSALYSICCLLFCPYKTSLDNVAMNWLFKIEVEVEVKVVSIRRRKSLSNLCSDDDLNTGLLSTDKP